MFIYIVVHISILFVCLFISGSVFHCVNISQCMWIHSSVDGTCWSFPLLAIIYEAAMNIIVPVFLWKYKSISLGYILWSGISGSWDKHMLNFSKVVGHFVL